MDNKPIDIEKYVLKEEVAKKYKQRIKEELLYTGIGMGGSLITYLAIIMGGVWIGILPIATVLTIGVLRINKLRAQNQYLAGKYEEKKEEEKDNFI